MSTAPYLLTGLDFVLAHAVEQSGDFLAAAGRLQHIGPETIDRLDDLTALERLRLELIELRATLDRLEAEIEVEPPAAQPS